MKIECKENPSYLIQEIGDPYFSVCDDTCDEIYRHKNNPNTLRIIDCEHNVYIDVTCETIDDTRKTAQTLCRLLNQDYDERPG